MRIEYNKDTPHFSSEELREIYRNTEEKTSKALRQTAHRLYPGRDSVTYDNLFIREGYARAYMHKGEYRKPKWTITAWPLMLGVMDDDTIYLIKEIQIYPNGESEMPLRSIEFNFPIYRDGQEVRRLLWEKGNTVETVALLSRGTNPLTGEGRAE